MGKKFYGLTGTKLNIAIAVVAGTDFALFGYGMLLSSVKISNCLSIIQTKVLWVVCLHCPPLPATSLKSTL